MTADADFDSNTSLNRTYPLTLLQACRLAGPSNEVNALAQSDIHLSSASVKGQVMSTAVESQGRSFVFDARCSSILACVLFCTVICLRLALWRWCMHSA